MKEMAVTELYPRLHENAPPPPPPPLHPHHVPFYAAHHPAMGVTHHQYFPGTPPMAPAGGQSGASGNEHHQWQQTASGGHVASGYQGYHSGAHHQMFTTPTPTLASLDSSGSMKRPYSDASDGDDGFSDSESKPHDSSANTTGGSSGANNTTSSSGGSGGGSTRKKRRGIIEKRRRDRINNSLSELRRLVPAAFEKQGSAKLEKAEILQMTVDHLKMLHAKGLDALAYDPHKIAVDYHSVGFRECAAEVARYLVAVEGMDIQDPLRLRLMSHLQCFSAQRDLANKSASSWGFNQHHNLYAPPPFGAATTGYADPHSHHHHHHAMSHPAELLSAAATSSSGAATSGTSTATNGAASSTAASGTTATSPANASSPYNGATNNPGTPMAWSGGHHGQPTALNFNSALSSSAAASAAASEYALNAQMKPYRPWGAELAY